MAKVEIELVKRIMERLDIENEIRSQIMEEIKQAMEEQQIIEDEQVPIAPEKKQFVILVSDPYEELPKKDFVGWVVQIPEDAHPNTAEERICKGAYEFNDSPKGRRFPVKTIGEACESVSQKFFKEQKLSVKTKEPVLIVRTSNKLPGQAKLPKVRDEF